MPAVARRQFPLALLRPVLRRAGAESYMCRLRIPNGILTHWQFAGLADLAERYGGGYAMSPRAPICRCAKSRRRTPSRDRGDPGSRPVLARLRRRQHPQRHRHADRRHRSAGTDRHPPLRARMALSTSSTTARCTGCRASSTSPSTAAAASPRWKTPTTSASRRSRSAKASASSRASGSGSCSAASPATRISRATPASSSGRTEATRSPTPSCASSSTRRPHQPQQGAAQICARRLGRGEVPRRGRGEARPRR